MKRNMVAPTHSVIMWGSIPYRGVQVKGSLILWAGAVRVQRVSLGNTLYWNLMY